VISNLQESNADIDDLQTTLPAGEAARVSANPARPQSRWRLSRCGRSFAKSSRMCA